MHNPLDADLVLEFVQSDAGVNGETFAQFSQPFDSFIVPPGQTVNSGVFGNVLLTQGAIASLDIIPLGFLDVQAAATVRIGQGGYQVPFLKLQQQGVPTAYDLSLDTAAAKEVASSAAASSLSASETPLTTTLADNTKSAEASTTHAPSTETPAAKPLSTETLVAGAAPSISTIAPLANSPAKVGLERFKR